MLILCTNVYCVEVCSGTGEVDLVSEGGRSLKLSSPHLALASACARHTLWPPSGEVIAPISREPSAYSDLSGPRIAISKLRGAWQSNTGVKACEV
jgi:hypothetical protein